MRSLYLRLALTLALGGLIHGAPALAEEQPQPSGTPHTQPPAETGEASPTTAEYLRLRRNDDGLPLALETAVVRFVSPAGPGAAHQVDLVAVVHVGDQPYYRELNRRLSHYDAVLYELVAPKGTRIPRGGPKRPGSAVGVMQGGMKNMLGLSFQLEAIDYSPDNFVHADMTPEQLAETMRARDESFAKMMFRMMGKAMVVESSTGKGGSELQMLKALFAKDRSHGLKVFVAEQFERMEQMGGDPLAGENGSVLVGQRNAEALKVLRQQLDRGQKRLAIFYGAAHMPDFADRLQDQFQLEKTASEWLTAWDLRQ